MATGKWQIACGTRLVEADRITRIARGLRVRVAGKAKAQCDHGTWNLNWQMLCSAIHDGVVMNRRRARETRYRRIGNHTLNYVERIAGHPRVWRNGHTHRVTVRSEKD